MKSEKMLKIIESIFNIAEILFEVYAIITVSVALWSWVFNYEFDVIFWKIGLVSFVTILGLEAMYNWRIKPKGTDK